MMKEIETMRCLVLISYWEISWNGDGGKDDMESLDSKKLVDQSVKQLKKMSVRNVSNEGTLGF